MGETVEPRAGALAIGYAWTGNCTPNMAFPSGEEVAWQRLNK